jgi:hypothetical protein
MTENQNKTAIFFDKEALPVVGRSNAIPENDQLEAVFEDRRTLHYNL